MMLFNMFTRGTRALAKEKKIFTAAVDLKKQHQNIGSESSSG